MLSFVSGNSEKIQKAREALGTAKIDFACMSFELLEIQANSSREVAENKVQQAFTKAQGSALVNDASWSLPALRDFPGPYMNQVNQWFSVEDWMNLLSPYSDRSIVMTECLSFYDGSTLKTFTQARIGYVLPKIEGILPGSSPIDNIATFTEDELSIAQRREKNLSAFPNDTAIWAEFTQWYLEQGFGQSS